ncbi:bifunctional phosphopantothenoylcysteine decarboxylase/phosphopantothenate--cysteine ligase CoaBC [Bartonella sp. HY329]|uniref:bifunctional phosphopantothenoylcysteine decarboxylase/phosphopantothenate--cysteine ligase CoaBC n=1 Tax=unclassified Bartonella TaxID=2645622 RepID=UPI0021C74B18|nr:MULTISPECIES: bifunctional phosphopantothenoylcysteine decarboxylase/phosphopantothenate--cysteine ligase CoaBC [unclassified Bartonella]UXM95348.1 bifunctional phosphopantothenoylcysteine decarboxylase/phosphopantothenate--cysteine ligase CoaBC [Bartonella sp. HY329]UXN09673.1 bifunctional phosphopantothenoylcysteine decarboxylase/phosphopantothenate--cysteine ligase CoaBC [Bartonella sp. HY328]
MDLNDKKILLIIGGSIAAYKSLDLIRRLRENGANVTVVMTKAAQEIITPLAAGALSANHVYTDLFSRLDEQDVGHIRLARNHDLIIVAPCSASRMAKMAIGIGDDLAGAIILARNCPILCAPAMNPMMWQNPATKRNLKILQDDGFFFIGPEKGEMAEAHENGFGRMSEPLTIVEAAKNILLDKDNRPLSGRHIIVTSGPTHEPIDPVRYIANRSSGKQGHAIAKALGHLGAKVTLVSGPVTVNDLQKTPFLDIQTIHVETAHEMLQQVEIALPADAAIFAAAVADWRMDSPKNQKMKKQQGQDSLTLSLVQNPDILATIAHGDNRPKLVIGFAAETNDLISNAQKKLEKKAADWIIANDVSINEKGESIMGGDQNHIYIVQKDKVEEWPLLDKWQVAEKLAEKIADYFAAHG